MTTLSRRVFSDHKVGTRSRLGVMPLLFVLCAFVVIPALASGKGLLLEQGQAAPFGGVLISEDELVALLAKKDHAYRVLKVESESALKVCNIELKAANEDATRWEELAEIRGKKNIALRKKYQGVINHVNRWRFGIGLLFIKSPENIRVE